MVDNNDALIREVDEELRREQFAKLWERYGMLVIGAAVAVVLGVAGYKWNEARKVSAAQEAGARFEAAVNLADENKTDGAIKAFADITQSGPTGYAILAGLRQAGALAKSGKAAEAVTAYEKVATSSPDPMLRAFAQLQAAALRLGTADFAEMQNRLNELMADLAPYRASAHELMGLAALKAGKIAEARQALEKLLGDPKVPPSLAQRVQVLMSEVAAAEMASGKAVDKASGAKADGAPQPAPTEAKKQ